MNLPNKKDPSNLLESKSNNIITNLNEYRNSRKIQIRHSGYIYSGIESTEAEARKDKFNWLKNLALRALAGFDLKPLISVERRAC